MRWCLSAVLYTALSLSANAAPPTTAALEALRDGSMDKLVFLSDPVAAPDTVFLDAAGAQKRLGDYRGKVVLLNFWATWCAPCRKELPALDALNRDLGGAEFEVVTIATGRNPPQAMDRLFAETGVTTLPRHTDAQMELARGMGVMGLPVSVILDAEGREIARMSGDADWDSDSARAILSALMAAD